MTTLQNIHHAYCILQFLIVILQESTPLLSSQRFEKNTTKSSTIFRCGLYLKAKACRISLEMCRVWKLHAMSLVMWTCQNDLGLNLCVASLISHMITISENSLIRSYKERSKVHCHWYWRFSIKFSQLSD